MAIQYEQLTPSAPDATDCRMVRRGADPGPYSMELVEDTVGAASWGGITGNLSDQTDLQDALDAKAGLSGGTFTGSVDVAAGLVVSDATFQIKDDADPTKIATFQLSSISAGQTRTLTVPDGSGTLALLGQTQTFSGQKTFSTPPVMATPTTLIASTRLPHGVAPSAPTNGDVWTTTSGLYVQINGATVGPLVSGDTQVTKWGPIMAAQQNLMRV